MQSEDCLYIRLYIETGPKNYLFKLKYTSIIQPITPIKQVQGNVFIYLCLSDYLQIILKLFGIGKRKPYSKITIDSFSNKIKDALSNFNVIHRKLR